MATTITLEGVEHVIGDDTCRQDWCNTINYPKRCECGGLIHAAYIDEDYEGNLHLKTECDICGEPDEY